VAGPINPIKKNAPKGRPKVDHYLFRRGAEKYLQRNKVGGIRDVKGEGV